MVQAAKIPVIDILGGVDQAQVARELVDAAIEHGFVYIKNTGQDISVEDIDAAFEISRRLFDAPLSEKQACTIQQNNRGWSAMNYETLDPANQRVGDFKEAFNFGDFLHHKAQQPLPPTIAADEPRISAFSDACYALSLRLTALLGLGLGVSPSDFFTAAHLRERGPSGTILRLLRYPPRADVSSPSDADGDGGGDESVMRAGAHSDYGSLTLLFRLRGQPGLEVLGRDGKTWSPVPVVPPGTEDDPAPPILMNIGDLLSYWTGGLLRSTVHRVVFPSGQASGSGTEEEMDYGPRYSMAYFCHPFGGTELGPVPSERVRGYKGGLAEGNPYAEQRVMTADEHLQMRLKASYAQLYEEKE